MKSILGVMQGMFDDIQDGVRLSKPTALERGVSEGQRKGQGMITSSHCCHIASMGAL